jgi:hypothetical protein
LVILKPGAIIDNVLPPSKRDWIEAWLPLAGYSFTINFPLNTSLLPLLIITSSPKYCLSVIEAAWHRPVSGSPAHCLVNKLLHTKKSLKRWNYLHFGEIQARIKSTLAKLDLI